MARKLILFLMVASALTFAILGAVSLAAADTTTTTTLGTDGHLANETAAIEYHNSGITTAEYAAPNLSVTAAEEGADCNVERRSLGPFELGPSDLRNDYLCVTYGEDVDRTLQIYVTAGVWSPYEREEVNPVEGGPHASFDAVRIDGQRYFLIELHVTEPGTYTYPIRQESSFISERVSKHKDRVGNVTGVGVAEQDEWKYISPEDYGEENVYVLQVENGTDSLLLEYREESTEEWQTVPEGSEDYAPVYYEKTDNGEVTIVAPGAETPPELRYTEDPTGATTLDNIVREVKNVPKRINDLLGGLLGTVAVGGAY